MGDSLTKFLVHILRCGLMSDVAYGWRHMPFDNMLASILSEKFVDLDRKQTFIPMKEYDVGPETSVLLIGNYWSKDSVESLLNKTKHVTFYPMCEDDASSYSDVPGAERMKILNFTLKEFEDIGCRWIKAVARRHMGKATEEDEAIYRGLCAKKEEFSYHTLCDLFDSLMEMDNDTLSAYIEDARVHGEWITRVNDMNAKIITRDHGQIFEWKGLLICTVQRLATPVVNYTIAASKAFSVNQGRNVDVGVSWCHDFANDVTRYSIRTEYPERVSLDFVKELIEHSGGPDHSKGGLLQGIRRPPITSMDDIRITMTKGGEEELDCTI